MAIYGYIEVARHALGTLRGITITDNDNSMKSFAAIITIIILLLPSSEAFFAFSSNPGLVALGKKTNAAAAALLQPRFMAAIDDDVTASTTTTTTTAKQSFDSFDYNSHWYPVSWSQDVPLNQPTRVTLFDVDYVIAKTTLQGDDTSDDNNDNEGEVFYAMIDSCPHKKVALSEGRITDCGTPDKKYFQCSYHGKYS